MKLQMTVAVPWQPILKKLSRRLADKGFVTRETFDLQLASRSLRTSHALACPHHGSDRCTCQYLVLHVGRFGQKASAVVLHGYDKTTKVALISSAGEKLDEVLAAEICESVRHWNRQSHRVRDFGARAIGMTSSPPRRGGG